MTLTPTIFSNQRKQRSNYGLTIDHPHHDKTVKKCSSVYLKSLVVLCSYLSKYQILDMLQTDNHVNIKE